MATNLAALWSFENEINSHSYFKLVVIWLYKSQISLANEYDLI
jgi:hypothetical protein